MDNKPVDDMTIFELDYERDTLQEACEVRALEILRGVLVIRNAEDHTDVALDNGAQILSDMLPVLTADLRRLCDVLERRRGIHERDGQRFRGLVSQEQFDATLAAAASEDNDGGMGGATS